MPEELRLVKLVRGDVEKFCGGDMVVRYAPMPHPAFVMELRKKLAEEVAEYLLNPCVEELGDVLTVVEALATHDLRIDERKLKMIAAQKSLAKGSFIRGLGMYLHNAPEHR